jgi:acetylornithine deacetylase/succinyl-diaminopimelate desuccinylase-like protein
VDIEKNLLDAIEARVPSDIERIVKLVRQPSVSIDGSGMRESAELIAELFRELGCEEVEIIETSAHPLVWAYLDSGSEHTLINYGMYDERPAGATESWTNGEPFSGEIAPADGFPSVLYGRGGLVPKGPIVTWLSALASYRSVRGNLPFNVAFLFEGSEIIGSPGFMDVALKHEDRMKNAFGCLYLRASQSLDGQMPLFLGYKSFFTIELKVTGAAWGRGPATAPAHSGARSVVDSPVERLVHALDTLFTAEGDIAVEPWLTGFDGDSRRPRERALVDDLLRQLEGKSWADAIPGVAGTGVTVFAGDVAGTNILDRYLYQSSLNIQGLYAGYTGPGTRTYTIPHEATALLDVRLVTSQSVEEIIQGLRDHLDSQGFADIQMDVRGAFAGSDSAVDSLLISAFVDAAEWAGASMKIWPRTGGGGPWAALADHFGVPVVMGAGIGTGKRGGLVDEYLVLDGGGRAPGIREMEIFGVKLIENIGAALARGDAR